MSSYKSVLPLLRVNRLWRRLGSEMYCRYAIFDVYEDRPDLFDHNENDDETAADRLIALETCSNIPFIIAHGQTSLTKSLTIFLGNLADPDSIINGLARYGFFDAHWSAVRDLTVIFDHYDMQQTGTFRDGAVSDLNRKLLDALPNVCGIRYVVYLDSIYGQPLIGDFIKERAGSLTELDFETDAPHGLGIDLLPKTLTSLRYGVGPHSTTTVFPKFFAQSLKSLTLDRIGRQALQDLFFDDSILGPVEFTELVDLSILFNYEGQDPFDSLEASAVNWPKFPRLSDLKIHIHRLDALTVLSMFPVHQLNSLAVKRGLNASCIDVSKMPKLLSLVLDMSAEDAELLGNADMALPIFLTPSPLRTLVLISESNIRLPQDTYGCSMLEELDISRTTFSVSIIDILSCLPKLKKLVVYIASERELGPTPVLGPSIKDSLAPVSKSLEFLNLAPTWLDLEPMYVERVVWFIARLPSLLRWQHERVFSRHMDYVAELFDQILCSEGAHNNDVSHLRDLSMCEDCRRF